MTNKTMQERLEERFSNMHNVENWGHETCDCDDDPRDPERCTKNLLSFIEQECLRATEAERERIWRGVCDIEEGFSLATANELTELINKVSTPAGELMDEQLDKSVIPRSD